MHDAPRSLVAQRERLYAEAVQRSRSDLLLRRALLEQPRETLNALARELGLGAQVPDGVRIQVLEADYDVLHLLLPPPAVRPLTETELDSVTGGATTGAAAALEVDAHGCPSCPHSYVGPLLRRF